MISKQLLAQLEPILTKTEIEVVLKRLNNRPITQTESNYLSRSIRPKLKSAEIAASIGLRSLLSYRRKKYERKDALLANKIIGATHNLSIKAIALFGSYIRNSHTNYRDIDLMVVLNRKTWKTSAQKRKLETGIERAVDIVADVSLVVYRELTKALPYSPLLQSELEDYKVIYGDLRISKKIIIDKAYLYSKLLETEYVLALKNINSRYIYNAIRTCISIQLFLGQTVDNQLTKKTIEHDIGRSTTEALLDNKANTIQRDIALRYLKYLYKHLMNQIEQKTAA
ncbi:MAG: nucleotidyltransferase domain-containing protein [archaeon]